MPIKSEFPKLFGPWTPICKLFFSQPKKTQNKVLSEKKESLYFQSLSNFIIFVPKTRCSQKKSSFPISLQFRNFGPANKLFLKKTSLLWTSLGFHGMDSFPSILIYLITFVMLSLTICAFITLCPQSSAKPSLRNSELNKVN